MKSRLCKCHRCASAARPSGAIMASPAHNPAVTGSNPVPATCFDGSEIWVGLYERPASRDVGLFAFYRQFWQRVRASPRFSDWRSLRVARDALSSPTSPRRPDLGRNSLLSLRLAPFGLTAVGSARTAHNPLGLRSVRSQRHTDRPSLPA